MEFDSLKKMMAQNGERIRMLVDGVPQEEARWKPDPETWSLLEVVNHLYDEEREDFRVRLRIILESPDQDWPPIDPGKWVTERNYNQRKMDQSIKDFLSERRASLEWLETLDSPDWEASCQTPFGQMRAGDMFASWVAHDQLHMRQMLENHRALMLKMTDPYRSEYAGEW